MVPTTKRSTEEKSKTGMIPTLTGGAAAATHRRFAGRGGQLQHIEGGPGVVGSEQARLLPEGDHGDRGGVDMDPLELVEAMRDLMTSPCDTATTMSCSPT